MQQLRKRGILVAVVLVQSHKGGSQRGSQRGLTKMSSSTMSTEPCSAAWCSGVQLPWSFITISCLPAASRRDATTSTWPISAAKCRGVCRLLDVLHTLAFCWMSIFTNGNQPVHHTQNSVKHSASHAAHISPLLDEHPHHPRQPAWPSYKTVPTVSLMLHTFAYCWMSTDQPTSNQPDQ